MNARTTILALGSIFPLVAVGQAPLQPVPVPPRYPPVTAPQIAPPPVQQPYYVPQQPIYAPQQYVPAPAPVPTRQYVAAPAPVAVQPLQYVPPPPVPAQAVVQPQVFVPAPVVVQPIVTALPVTEAPKTLRGLAPGGYKLTFVHPSTNLPVTVDLYLKRGAIDTKAYKTFGVYKLLFRVKGWNNDVVLKFKKDGSVVIAD